MKIIHTLHIALAATAALSTGCDEETPMKWVDLRYDVPQESYTIDAAGTEKVSIRVSSTDPWEVFGSKREDWYTISPDSGEAGKIYTVTITCDENTSLDDRRDTINVKSDYWTGKQFLLTQKGTAYLNVGEAPVITRQGDETVLEILTNQDWTARITSGEEWLSISEGTQGRGNGNVVFAAGLNSGEQRIGEVTVYDRNGDVAHVVPVSQIGIILSPMLPDNGKFHALYSQQQELVIPVESNVGWTASKPDSDDDAWYQISGGDTYDGTDNLVITVSAYPEGGATAARTGTVTIASMEEEGAETVVKTILFKQASPETNRTLTYQGQTLDKNGFRSDYGQQAGRYTFHLAPFTASDRVYLYFLWERDGSSFAELRFWLNSTFAPLKTELSTKPYCNDVNKWQNNLLVPFDNTQPVKIAFDIQESEPDNSGNTWIYTEWWLNDRLIAKAVSDGIADLDGKTDTWRVPYAETSAGGYIWIFAESGSAVLEKWEYTSPVDWGE